MNETEKEHLKKVYTAYYSQIDFTKDFCEQNIKHITNMQKLPQYSSTPLFKFDRRTTALVYSLHSVSLICKDLMEHIKKEIVEHFENEPSHYTFGKYECIDVIEELSKQNNLQGIEGFLYGNIIKYLWRYKHKNGIEDLQKARWYLDRLISNTENDYKPVGEKNEKN